MRGVGNGGDQAGIDHGRAQPQQDAGQKPPLEAPRHRRQQQPAGLDPHARDDQPLATSAVVQKPGEDLAQAPDHGMHGAQDGGALDAQAEAGCRPTGPRPGSRTPSTPKLMMKDRVTAELSIWNYSAPISGTTVRSIPTMPPTKALMSTSSENCRQFSFRPRRMAGAPDATLDAMLTSTGRNGRRALPPAMRAGCPAA